MLARLSVGPSLASRTRWRCYIARPRTPKCERLFWERPFARLARQLGAALPPTNERANRLRRRQSNFASRALEIRQRSARLQLSASFAMSCSSPNLAKRGQARRPANLAALAHSLSFQLFGQRAFATASAAINLRPSGRARALDKTSGAT